MCICARTPRAISFAFAIYFPVFYDKPFAVLSLNQKLPLEFQYWQQTTLAYENHQVDKQSSAMTVWWIVVSFLLEFLYVESICLFSLVLKGVLEQLA